MVWPEGHYCLSMLVSSLGEKVWCSGALQLPLSR